MNPHRRQQKRNRPKRPQHTQLNPARCCPGLHNFFQGTHINHRLARIRAVDNPPQRRRQLHRIARGPYRQILRRVIRTHLIRLLPRTIHLRFVLPLETAKTYIADHSDNQTIVIPDIDVSAYRTFVPPIALRERLADHGHVGRRVGIRAPEHRVPPAAEFPTLRSNPA